MGKPALAKRAALRRHAVSRKRRGKAKKTNAPAYRELVIFLKSPTGERFIVLEIFILTAMTLLIYMLYQKELKRRQEIQEAVGMIRTIVVAIDPANEYKNDLAILAAALNLSEELRYFANLNDRLQKDIDNVIKNLKNGWLTYERSLYWFSNEVASWVDAQKRCERQSAKLISVESKNEQYYVSTGVDNLKNNYWIGLYKDKGGKWKWLSGKIASDTYWNRNQPNNEAKHDCVALTFDCRNPRCWMTVQCHLPINFICKKVPKDIWL